MGKIQDITGNKYNHWTVLKFDKRKGNDYYWQCKCDCGTIKSINSSSLKNRKKQMLWLV